MPDLLHPMPGIKYFRYRRKSGLANKWLYAHIKEDGNIEFTGDWRKASELNRDDIQAAFANMDMRNEWVLPEQMTEEEFAIIQIMLS